jgi:hypothetical protein
MQYRLQVAQLFNCVARSQTLVTSDQLRRETRHLHAGPAGWLKCQCRDCTKSQVSDTDAVARWTVHLGHKKSTTDYRLMQVMALDTFENQRLAAAQVPLQCPATCAGDSTHHTSVTAHPARGSPADPVLYLPSSRCRCTVCRAAGRSHATLQQSSPLYIYVLRVQVPAGCRGWQLRSPVRT